ncbi:FmdB family zinc ribbon protein [Maridesulfovibrio hydrothermalis]|uniref:Regulatory protein, FmdB family n=1 Tax=Maridesulfovibrio hydrothermalis AM13 = DSM 14728 TaxID=1121451 RepID=L0R9R3_9BACT|nr:zinc ribbon domain-containing protein [Maridesulfovibrio hydrothermalis]CCO23518.1 Regulatory protein, FmdB family [Maridesulfovibrio hydrothermalis AM13 = DSM 14728]
MPIYEYQCHECQQIFEEWQTTFEDKELECAVCGGLATKVLSNSSFVLKGGGWYSSGYCKTDSAAGKSSSSGAGSSSGASASSDSAPKSTDSA